MNDLMSGGLHRLWKSDFLAWLGPPREGSGRPYRLLDVAGGTATWHCVTRASLA